MNILGLCGSIGWDGNIPFFVEELNSDFWIHGSGATLIMDGELKNSMCEERFSRIKYDGAYPKLAIQTILDNNKITKHDIDVVVYVCSHIEINLALRQKGYISAKIKEYFPNCTVEYLPHHIAHAAATFYTSGFEEANILSFDGAGDHEVQPNGQLLICHFKFLSGKGSKLIEHQSAFGHYGPMDNSFGNIYSYFSEFAYKKKMNLAPNTGNKILEESYPGRIMGLAAYGDHTKIDIPVFVGFGLHVPHLHGGHVQVWPRALKIALTVELLNRAYLTPSDEILLFGCELLKLLQNIGPR